MILVFARLFAEYKRDYPDDARTTLGALLVAGVPFLLIVAQPDLGTAMTFLAIVGGGLRPGRPEEEDRRPARPGRARPRRRRLELRPQGLPEEAADDPGQSRPGPAGLGLPGHPVQDRHRLGRADRQGLQEGHAEPAALPAGPPHRFHLLGHRRGDRLPRRVRRSSPSISSCWPGCSCPCPRPGTGPGSTSSSWRRMLIAFQFLVNILMIIGLFPVVGITLPFLSYGGSSLLVEISSPSGSSSTSRCGGSPMSETVRLRPGPGPCREARALRRRRVERDPQGPGPGPDQGRPGLPGRLRDRHVLSRAEDPLRPAQRGPGRPGRAGLRALAGLRAGAPGGRAPPGQPRERPAAPATSTSSASRSSTSSTFPTS